MIGLRDSLTLATTKLRVRKTRLAVTIIVAGLLFSTLVFGSLFARGLVHSIKSFMSQGLLNRYVLIAQSFPDYRTNDAKLIARVLQLEKAQIEAKKAEAKRLKIPYDASTEQSAVFTSSTPDGQKVQSIGETTPLVNQALAELQKPDTLEADLRQTLSTYSNKGLTTGQTLGFAQIGEYSLQPIIGTAELPIAQNYDPGEVLSQITSSLQALDPKMLQPFTLPDTSLDAPAGQPIPAILPISAVEKLLDRKPLGRKATPEQQLEYLRQIRSDAKNLKFQVCYRNKEAITLKQLAEQQVKDAAAKPAGYVAPALQYAIPTAACTLPTVSKDTRSAAEKTLAIKQDQFDQKFGKEPAAVSKIDFKVIGVLPRFSYAYQADDPLGLAGSFLTSSLGDGLYIPQTAVNNQPVLAKLFNNAQISGRAAKIFYLEFPDRFTQKAFSDAHSCNGGGDETVINECLKNHQYFINPFGNPLATLADMAKQFELAKIIIISVMATIAGLIMMGTIGKVIADSRKETSVFRAVGARRRDIIQIYLIFSVFLAIGGLIVACLVGLAAALYVDHISAPSLTVKALLAFNSSDLNKTFHLLWFDLGDILKLTGFVLFVGLAGASVPLAGNIQRSPIKDMREE